MHRLVCACLVGKLSKTGFLTSRPNSELISSIKCKLACAYSKDSNWSINNASFYKALSHDIKPGRVAQSVTCLATDACLTADPGVASSIPVRSHTFMEIDHEIISTVILLPSADSFKKGCCQLQAKVCAQITG